jgi:hypothetical protein
MDFLDPKKKKINSVLLIAGYFLVGTMILMGTIILLYSAYGFSLDKNGNIIQNGLVFVSSQPNPATVYVNGVAKDNTNARMILRAGQYVLQLKKSGYRTWQRAFNLEGGSVAHFDYPFLFPEHLIVKNTDSFASNPQIQSESHDRRWMLISQASTNLSFNLYDLNNPKLLPTTVTIPGSIINADMIGPLNIQVVEWSNDNRHILMKIMSSTNNTNEFVVFDRQDPASSVNLTHTLNLLPDYSVQLLNNLYNDYYIYSSISHTLYSASLQTPNLITEITHVLSFKSYSKNLILYSTDENAPSGEVNIRLKDVSKNYFLRSVQASPNYLLDLAQYNGIWYYAVGSSVEGRLYIFQNPEQSLQSQPSLPLVPINILHISQPNYVDFSSNTRFILVENNNKFAVYDAENDKAYSYTLPITIDSPQTHVTWMDDDRLLTVSGGKVTIFDYDSANLQQLESAEPNYIPVFDKSFKFIYVIALNTESNSSTLPYSLTNTALTTQ